MVDEDTRCQGILKKDFGSMWKGFAKSIYGVTQSMLVLLLLGVLGYMLFLGPFYALCDKCIFETDPRPCLILIAIQVLMILFMRLLMRDHFKESIYATIFHPLGLFFFLMNAPATLFSERCSVKVSSGRKGTIAYSRNHFKSASYCLYTRAVSE